MQGLVKSSTVKMKNAKPLEPWIPVANEFKPKGKSTLIELIML